MSSQRFPCVPPFRETLCATVCVIRFDELFEQPFHATVCVIRSMNSLDETVCHGLTGVYWRAEPSMKTFEQPFHTTLCATL
jgi:hypothetical protein